MKVSPVEFNMGEQRGKDSIETMIFSCFNGDTVPEKMHFFKQLHCIVFLRFNPTGCVLEGRLSA